MGTHGKGNFPYVLTIGVWHMICCSLFTVSLRWCAPNRFIKSWMPAMEGNLDLTFRKWMTSVLSQGILYAFCISLGLFSYRLCTVSFLQMMKAGIGPMIACVFSFIARTETASLSLTQIVAVICVG